MNPRRSVRTILIETTLEAIGEKAATDPDFLHDLITLWVARYPDCARRALEHFARQLERNDHEPERLHASRTADALAAATGSGSQAAAQTASPEETGSEAQAAQG